MSEYKKIIRRFELFTVWVLFVTLTLVGLITAGERTRFVLTGEQRAAGQQVRD